jgi:hypothetical protein
MNDYSHCICRSPLFRLPPISLNDIHTRHKKLATMKMERGNYLSIILLSNHGMLENFEIYCLLVMSIFVSLQIFSRCSARALLSLIFLSLYIHPILFAPASSLPPFFFYYHPSPLTSSIAIFLLMNAKLICPFRTLMVRG